MNPSAQRTSPITWWRTLFTPHSGVREENARERVQMLLITMGTSTVLDLFVFLVATYYVGFNLTTGMILVAMIGSGIAYVIGRTAYYDWAVWLMIGVTIVVVFVIIYTLPTAQIAMLAVFPIYMTSTFRPVRTILAVGLLVLLGVIGMSLWVVGDWHLLFVTVIFIAVTILMIVMNVSLRNHVETKLKRRTLELETSEARLRESLQIELDRQRLQIELDAEREISQLKSNLLFTITHEFVTPLTIIGAQSDILERYNDRQTDEQRAERLQTIRAQINRLNDMLNDAKLLVRGTTQGLPFKPVMTDMCQFLNEKIATLHATFAVLPHIELTCVPDLPPVRVDSMLMNLIVDNLVSNAVKYSPSDSTVYVNVQVTAEQWSLSVADEGMGIPESEQAKIFEPFYRGSNLDAVGGTGLGLSIVRDAVSRHNAYLTLTSDVGKGTTFTVTFPN